MSEPVRALLAALKQVFAGENLPCGDSASAAIDEVLAKSWDPPRAEVLEFQPLPLSVLAGETGPLAKAVEDSLPWLDWHYSGLENGRIRRDISLAMQTVEIVGPTGMIPHATVRIGLFAQSARLDYITRVHAAEEVFVMVAGEGWWAVDDATPTRRLPGDVMHHPSMAPHKSITYDRPLLAAWHWTGDIAYEAYELVG